MKIERSCGAVVFTRVNGEIKYVLVRQLSGFYGFPKGHMEEGETERQTAKREIKEEVGLTPVFLDGFVSREEYVIPGKKNVMKTVTYFLGEYRNQTIRPQKEELLGARLVPFAEAYKLIRFESCKRILKDADDILSDLYGSAKRQEKKQEAVLV